MSLARKFAIYDYRDVWFLEAASPGEFVSAYCRSAFGRYHRHEDLRAFRSALLAAVTLAWGSQAPIWLPDNETLILPAGMPCAVVAPEVA